jgi:hypothetical protein
MITAFVSVAYRVAPTSQQFHAQENTQVEAKPHSRSAK